MNFHYPLKNLNFPQKFLTHMPKNKYNDSVAAPRGSAPEARLKKTPEEKGRFMREKGKNTQETAEKGEQCKK